uniref:Uncharacterized protein n=1 Tax=Panagrolaimus davidi TaxID=227884 RepID=A0A914Q6M0_9BILA
MNNTTYQRTDIQTVIGPEGQVSTGPLHLEHEKEKHGLLHDIKEGVKDVVETITGKSEPTPKDHIKEAKHLQKKADDVLDDTHKDFKKAQKAQEKADKVAEKANHKTEKALNKQAHGQELLAEAGAELIEAGAKLQREAATDINQAPYNVHQKGQVQQTTLVDAAGQRAAAAAHDATIVRDVRYGATHATH